ncbi:carboxypeptidase-like regulatory domain-containing protein [Flavobacterium sp. EDS]|uniref:carboxypeptidase-like regulatory domain-containing protein n=1 Tax=Flavobacterium sp. EDS TaxID=2897328 RepID=UPI001E50B3E8|nr:carboxypeptidase-like regulatory domain-containing protein [Flavobacterium sp. EDS]MCD0474182.1 carboxypeptidase-like regulatory domain-containing protein [Flavobacterium sp. EDS]
MLVKYYKILLFLAFWGSGINAWAQNNSFNIEFTNKKIETNSKGVIDAYVKIINTSSQSIEGVFDAHSSHEDIYLSLRKSKNITIAAHDSIFIPIKAIVATTAKAGNQSTIEAVFTIVGTQETKNVFLPVYIRERKLVKVMLLETNLIYERIGDSLAIPIRISNEGNTAQKVTILARYPDFITRNAIENTDIHIQAFTDTIVVLKKVVNKTVLNQEDITINITALYSNGDIINNGTVRASSIRQDRRYVSPYNPDYNLTFNQTNQVTASIQHNSDNTNAYFIYANAQAEINKGVLQANVDVNWWENSDQVFLRNTWLSYKEKNYGATIGNISKFFDLNLIGRGAEGFFKPNEKSTIEAGAIDKTYNLIDDSSLSFGKSAWAMYTHNNGWMQKKGYENTIIYDDDTYSGTKNYLASSRFSLYTSENFNLRAGGAISNLTSEIETGNKIGGAGEVQFNGKLKNLFYSSSNYLSSGYFSGMRKGVINLNERVNLPVGKFNLWGVYNYLSAKPESFANQFTSTHFSTARYDVGVSRRFSSLILSLSPYYYTESRKEQLLSTTNPNGYSMKAARMTLGLTYYNTPTNQNVSLSFEGGQFTATTIDKNEFHFKTNFIYSWKILNLLAFYQYNNFYLGEIIANSQLGIEKVYTNLTISPTLQQKFFNDKLTVNLGMVYSKNSMINESLQINGRLDYDISKDFSLFVYNYYSDFSTSINTLNTIQLGLTKRFNPIKIDKTKSELEVYVYYETGDKNKATAKNTPATNQLVLIDGKAFRTDNKGILKYRSLPAGSYIIKPINTDEWYANAIKATINADTKIAIGLNKTASIKGSLSYVATDKSFDITKKKGGLPIIAIDDNGNVFTTKTDENGNFVLYIPKGSYTVSLEKTGISEYVEVENNNQLINAAPDEIKEVKFTLAIKEKRVETRKFSSNGFKKQ